MGRGVRPPILYPPHAQGSLSSLSFLFTFSLRSLFLPLTFSFFPSSLLPSLSLSLFLHLRLPHSLSSPSPSQRYPSSTSFSFSSEYSLSRYGSVACVCVCVSVFEDTRYGSVACVCLCVSVRVSVNVCVFIVFLYFTSPSLLLRLPLHLRNIGSCWTVRTRFPFLS